MLLSAGKSYSSLADYGLIALLQIVYKIRRLSCLRRPFHSFVRSRLIVEGYILLHRFAEKKHILHDRRKCTPHIAKTHVLLVHSVQRDLARCRIVEAHHDICKYGFPGARLAHYTQLLAQRQINAYIGKHRMPVKNHIYMLQLKIAASAYLRHIRLIRQLIAALHELHYLGRAGVCLLRCAYPPRYTGKQLRNIGKISAGCHKAAYGKLIAENKQRAHNIYKTIRQRRTKIHRKI